MSPCLYTVSVLSSSALLTIFEPTTLLTTLLLPRLIGHPAVAALYRTSTASNLDLLFLPGLGIRHALSRAGWPDIPDRASQANFGRPSKGSDQSPGLLGAAAGVVFQVRNRLTDQQRDELVQRLRAGESRRALADEYNVHPVTVWRLNKKREEEEFLGGGQASQASQADWAP